MRRTVLIYLWAIAFIAYVQRTAISVPLEEIGRDVNAGGTSFASATQALGFLQSAWYFGYAMFQLPGGGLADRFGGRRALVLLAVFWSLATALAACARSYWMLVAAWTFMGCLQAGAFPCAVRSIGQLFDDRERARASGWLGAGMLAGGAIAPVLTAWLIEGLAAAPTGIAPWRLCLLLYSVPGVAWAAAYWFGTRSAGLDSRRIAAADPAATSGNLTAVASSPSVWRRACSDRSLWLLCGQQFLRAAAMLFFVTWFPTFLRETRGVSLMASGLLTTYAGAAALLGILAGGYASDWLLARTGNKRLARQGLAVIGMGSCSMLMLLSSFVTDVNTAILLISAGAFIAMFGGVAGYTVAIDYGGDRAGTVFGAMNTAGGFGAMLFPVTIGWLVSATGTWNAALFAFVVLMAIDAVLWAVLNPKGTFLQAGPQAAALLVAIGLVSGAFECSSAQAAPPGYNADIRPLLSDRCFRCHGPDAASRQADLRLDRREEAVAARDGEAAIVPGDPEASTLYARIVSTDPDLQMPPPDSGSDLTATEREAIRAWIADGARYEPHWAFVPPVAARPPDVSDAASIRHPADRFIQARLETLGFVPEAEADPVTLCRRLFFDIVGLPPPPAEVDAFVTAYTEASDVPPEEGGPSPREAAYAALVDRLLASPRYGERMAGPWLDAARYADTNGYQTDGPRQMWRYRDWVIDAFNRNQPFDEFTIDQLAGDLLPEPTLAQRIATGFNRNHRMNAEGGVIPEEFLVEYVVDRVETTATVWLGLTAGCARCHDHKYDPLSQRDFYRIFDFFNRVPEPGKAMRDTNSPPVILAPTAEQETRLEALRAESAATAAAWDRLEPEVDAVEAAWLAAGPASSLPPSSRGFTIDSGLTLHVPLDRIARAAGRDTMAAPANVALAFDAGLPLESADILAFDTERPFSAAVWLRPEAASGETTVYAAWDAAALDQGIALVIAAGRPQVVIANRILDDVLRVESAEPLEPGRWTHVTWTYDGSRLAAGVRMHVDGRVVPTRTLNDELNNRFTNKRPLVLGGGGSAAAFRGAIADLRFFDRQLAPDESAIISCGATIESLIHDRRAKAGGRRSEGSTRRAGNRDAADLKLREFFLAHAAPESLRAARERMRSARSSLEAFEKSLPTTMVMQDVSGLRTTHVLARGEYDKPGEAVTAGVPEALGVQLPEGVPVDRLALARWLVDRRHPLTARVLVNRVWQQFFGVGLVKTSEDFGLQGETPPHRELLDWLAVDFKDHGWDMKRLVRQIVTTAAYRRGSRVDREAEARDPENRLFARGPRFRLSAEAVRDAALAVSELLAERVGGPSVKPYQPPGLWEELAAGAAPYDQDHGADLYRRSLYVYRKRTVAVPMFATFDAAGRETCQVRQSRTNTPLQALVLLNDVTFVEAARALAVRMMREGGDTAASRIAHGFVLVTCRRPRRQELDVLVAGFTRRLTELQNEPETAGKLLAHGESPVDPAIDPVELAAFTTVGNVLLNLDEFLTRE